VHLCMQLCLKLFLETYNLNARTVQCGIFNLHLSIVGVGVTVANVLITAVGVLYTHMIAPWVIFIYITDILANYIVYVIDCSSCIVVLRILFCDPDVPMYVRKQIHAIKYLTY